MDPCYWNAVIDGGTMSFKTEMDMPLANKAAAGIPITPGTLQVIKRNGQVTDFDLNKIKIAMTKAFEAVEKGAGASSRVRDIV
jgi:ribonucleoside-diphosphate reductase alpha chain